MIVNTQLFVYTIFLLALPYDSYSQNFNVEEILRQYNTYLLQDGVENECESAIQSLSPLSRLMLFDSSAKSLLPNGFLKMNFFDLGHFDECYGIKETVNETDIYGKYCLSTIPISLKQIQETSNPALRRVGTNSSLTGLHFGYCLPHTCTTEDFKNRFNFLDLTNFTEQLCYSQGKQSSFSAGDITAITIYSMFALLLLLSTLYDIFLYYSKQDPYHYALLAFSVLTNGKKIFKSTTNSDQLSCLHGIRAISMMWVLIGHTNSSLFSSTGTDNFVDMSAFPRDKKNLYLTNAPLSVDTFFTIGGLVTVYTFLKSMDKGVKFNIIMYYFHRYLRLTPALAALVLFNATLIRYFGNGPFWGAVEETITPCQKYWWSTLLYIQNYVNSDETCSGQTWYLSVDMQIFLFSPLLLIPLHKIPKVGIILTSGMAAFGVIIPFCVAYFLDIGQQLTSPNEEAQRKFGIYYYSQTYARFGPYVFGMLFGYIIYKYKTNKNLKEKVDGILSNKIIVLVSWIITIGGLISCLYAGADVLTENAPKMTNAIFTALFRNAWGIGVCLVVLLCIADVGGPINAFLSHPVWQFLAKLSYSMYLTHVPILTIKYSSAKVLTHFEELSVMYQFWSHFIVTVITSFVMCVTFESPFITLEKFSLRK